MRIPIRGSPDDWFAWLKGPDEKLWKDATLILGGLFPEDPVPPEPIIARLEDADAKIVFWAIIGLSGWSIVRRRRSRGSPSLPQATQHPGVSSMEISFPSVVWRARTDPRPVAQLQIEVRD